MDDTSFHLLRPKVDSIIEMTSFFVWLHPQKDSSPMLMQMSETLQEQNLKGANAEITIVTRNWTEIAAVNHIHA